jgi:hypothetical protein
MTEDPRPKQFRKIKEPQASLRLRLLRSFLEAIRQLSSHLNTLVSLIVLAELVR